MTVAVVLDACVLYPIGIRDVLLDLAFDLHLFRPLWSDQILDEMERNLVESGRCTKEQAAGLRQSLTEIFPDAEVQGYESLIPDMAVHPKDRHVLAAAVEAHADVIVTDNLKDFPPAACAKVGVRIFNADDFLTRCHDLHPGVNDVVRGVTERYGRHGRAFAYDEFVSKLFTTVPNFAGRLIASDHERSDEASAN